MVVHNGREDDEAHRSIGSVVLHDLHVFSQHRLRAGEGQHLLTTLGLTDAQVILAYEIGYLPSNVMDLLPKNVVPDLQGCDLADTVVLPAYRDGSLVDLTCIHADGSRIDSLTGDYLGTIGRTAPGESLTITDRPEWLGVLMGSLSGAVLFVRRPEDLEALGAGWCMRLAVGDLEAYRAACLHYGQTIHPETITVAAGTIHKTLGSPPLQVLASQDAPTPPVAPSSVSYRPDESDEETLVFRSDLGRYAVQTRGDRASRRRIQFRTKSGDQHQDPSCDFASPKQLQRFASSACHKLSVGPEIMTAELGRIWSEIETLEDAQDEEPLVAMDPQDTERAARTLRRPDLMDSLTEDLTALGWVGEDTTKRLLYLIAVSRLLEQPLWGVYAGSPSAFPQVNLSRIAQLIPEEAILHLSSVRAALLKQTPSQSFRHRLLILDHAEEIKNETATTLRMLYECGGVSSTAHVAGNQARRIHERRGPLAVLAAAEGPLDRRWAPCATPIPVDESLAQTQRIIAEQGLRSGSGNPGSHVADIIQRHHAMQRLLKRVHVVIPFSDRIAFPAQSVRNRYEHTFFLTLIRASTVLHQFQRDAVAGEPGTILASEADFHHAQKLIACLVGSASDGLRSGSRSLLQIISQTQSGPFSRKDLALYQPEWNWTQWRTHLNELEELGCIERIPKGMGVGGRGRVNVYRLVSSSPLGPSTTITLRPSQADKLAETGRTALVSLSPVRHAI